MIEKNLLRDIQELISIENITKQDPDAACFPDDNSPDLYARIRELRETIYPRIEKQYGMLFRLLIAADMLTFVWTGPQAGFALHINNVYFGGNGNTIDLAGDQMLSIMANDGDIPLKALWGQSVEENEEAEEAEDEEYEEEEA